MHDMRICLLGLLVVSAAIIVPAARALDETGALPLPVKSIDAATVTPYLNPGAAAWNDAPESVLHFNRTPPLYVGDATDDGRRPEVRLRLLRTGDGSVLLRARWADATEDELPAGKRYADVGDAHIYKEHSEAVNAFADAFCAMVPVKRGPQSPYPSMMMGEGQDPVELYYWRAGLGTQRMSAHGRASTATAGRDAGAAKYEGGGWTVTMVIANVAPKTPLCFAVWDGRREQCDGLKYFSLWYEVQ